MLQEVSKYISEYIKFADAKAAAVLTIIGMVGALSGVAAPTIFEAASADARLWWGGCVITGAVAISVVMGIHFTVAALMPRSVGAGESLASFPDIARLDVESYLKRTTGLTAEQVDREYALHNATLARVALAKFTAIRGALWWTRVAMVSGYCEAVLYAVSKTTAQ
jgi:hypothetical protein